MCRRVDNSHFPQSPGANPMFVLDMRSVVGVGVCAILFVLFISIDVDVCSVRTWRPSSTKTTSWTVVDAGTLAVFWLALVAAGLLLLGLVLFVIVFLMPITHIQTASRAAEAGSSFNNNKCVCVSLFFVSHKPTQYAFVRDNGRNHICTSVVSYSYLMSVCSV